MITIYSKNGIKCKKMMMLILKYNRSDKIIPTTKKI